MIQHLKKHLIIQNNIFLNSNEDEYFKFEDDKFSSMTPIKYVELILKEAMYDLQTDKFYSIVKDTLNDLSTDIFSNIFEILLFMKHEIVVHWKDKDYFKIRFIIRPENIFYEFEEKWSINTNINDLLIHCKKSLNNPIYKYNPYDVEKVYEEFWNTPMKNFTKHLPNLENTLKQAYKKIENLVNKELF